MGEAMDEGDNGGDSALQASKGSKGSRGRPRKARKTGSAVAKPPPTKLPALPLGTVAKPAAAAEGTAAWLQVQEATQPQ